MAALVVDRRVTAGTTVTVAIPGGGGHGDPAAREADELDEKT
jgi:N-methylhydantoinase B/oxoprolinase/acetone carboxylase alpha subunit